MVQDSRNFQGNPCADQDVGYAGEHRAINGRQMRKLDFFQIIDADRPIVAFPGQKDLRKIGDDAKLHEFS